MPEPSRQPANYLAPRAATATNVYRSHFYLQMLFALAIHLIATNSVARADQPPTSDVNLQFFREKIEPVLQRECYACHSKQAGAKIEAGLRLDAPDTMEKGGDSGPAIDRQLPKQSLILQAIKHEGGLAMPPERQQLSAAVIADFEQWLGLGAPDSRPPAADSAADSAAGAETTKAREHYAFQPLVDVKLPNVNAQSDVYQAIDAFLLNKLEAHGRGFAPIASRRTWLRRINLDVTAYHLPPRVSRNSTMTPAGCL